MSILSKLFGGGNSNPANSAMPYLDQIPGVAHQGYDPYVNAGLDASGRTKSTYEDLMNDPTAFMNKLMEAYKPSEAYGFQKDLLTKEMGNTAAAGGIAGTPLDRMNQAEEVQGLLSKDMQQFFQNALGIFNTGLQGEENIANRGYDATGRLTDTLGGALNQKGGLAFQGAQQKNSDRNGMLSALAKALGLGAGAFLGGAPGAAIGGGLSSSMFGGG